MKPHEFYDCTYNDVFDFIKCNSLQRELERKQQINLFENFGNKLIGALAFGNKRPKNINLIKDVYSELFKEELKQAEEVKGQPQKVEQQIANLRSWGSRISRIKKKREEVSNGTDN